MKTQTAPPAGPCTDAPSTETRDPRVRAALIGLAILGGCFSLSGCLAAALGAAYVAGEEIAEDDGDFDPLDEVVDGEKDND